MNVEGFISALSRTKIIYVIVGLAIYPLSQILCAMKWQYIARALGIRKDLSVMVRLYFIGMFFNLFLPTSIGGDITRSIYLDPDAESKRLPFLSVFIERATGVLSMLILASVVMLSPVGISLPRVIRFGFPAVSLLTFIGLWILPMILQRTNTKMRQVVCEDLAVFWNQPQITLVCIGYSVLFHSLLVVIHALIAASLSLSIPVLYHYVTMSVGSLISFLPSLNGVGVRDASYVYLLTRIGIDKEHAFLFSILWFFTMVVSGMLGCLVYVIWGLNRTAKTQRRENPDVARQSLR